MATLNKVFLIGNAGNDPQLYYVDGSIPMAKFSLATHPKPTQHMARSAEWHDVIAWNDLAEQAVKQIRKGALLYVEGRIQYRTWTNKQGDPQRDVNIVAEAFYVL